MRFKILLNINILKKDFLTKHVKNICVVNKIQDALN